MTVSDRSLASKAVCVRQLWVSTTGNRKRICYIGLLGLTDIERLLLGYKMIEKLNPQTARTWRRHLKSSQSGLIGGSVSSSDDGSDASDEDAEFGTISRGKKGDARGLRQGGGGLGLSGPRRNQDDDSDFDL